jgi:cell division protein FtsL
MKIPKINMGALKGTAKTAIKSVGNFASKNAPVLAASAAILCTAGAIVATVKATKKYQEEIQKAELAKNEEFMKNATTPGEDEEAPKEFVGLTKTEKLLIAAKCYWLVALLFVLSSGSVIASVKFSNRQIQALAILASTSEAALTRNEKAVEELLGKNKLEKIKMMANEQELKENEIPFDDNLIERSSLGGNTLFFDPMCHRYFYGDITKIEHAINEANALLLHDCGFLSVNEFYSALGLEGVTWGEYLGWDTETMGTRLIDVKLEYATNPHQQPIVILRCNTEPRHDWRNG